MEQTHAEKAGLTSSKDWATVNSDGNLTTKDNSITSSGDVRIAALGKPVHTTSWPTGTLEFLGCGERTDTYEGCCDAVTATLSALTLRMSSHPPKFLLLSGSLRAESCSRRVAIEVGRILASYGSQVKLFDATDLPLFSQDVDPKSCTKVAELRSLTRWCEGMVWISPEVHGNYSAVFKNQIDWMPLTEGAVRPTQGKTVAVVQVEAGSQSFNTVNNLRVLGRWMRMVVVPNQASIPRVYDAFNSEDGSLKEGPMRNRIVDLADELFKYTLLLRDQQPYLLQRYSEKTALEEKHIRETSQVATPSVLQALKEPIILDVRSNKEVIEGKGGIPIPGSIHVPINVDNQPQTLHRTTADEFRRKLHEAGVDLSTLDSPSFIAHCTKGNTEYTSRGNRAAALLRDIGFERAYNGGSSDDIRGALG